MVKYKKLRARYCGPYQITQNINDQAYRLSLPTHLKVHNVFHVSFMKSYIPDPTHILDDETIVTTDGDTFTVEPQEVLQTIIQTLCNQEIKEHLAKLSAYHIDHATWEREDQLLNDYPSFMFEVRTPQSLQVREDVRAQKFSLIFYFLLLQMLNKNYFGLQKVFSKVNFFTREILEYFLWEIFKVKFFKCGKCGKLRELEN